MTVLTSHQRLLQRALRQPADMAHFTAIEWDHLIRFARVADLSARVAHLAKAAGVWDAVPDGPRRHLSSAQLLAERQQRELGFELQEIELALKGLDVPVVLLKGAAYLASGLDAANGRVMSDVDVLVPKNVLEQAEAALMMAGWMTAARSEYDQRYYRTWMHELPPMQHIQRGTVIDVHHAILPLSARYEPSSELLLQQSRAIRAGSCLHVLSPVDMVLHSATHLMHEGNFEQGTRGLVDLDALLTEYGASPDFWPQLVPRAKALQLVRPLFYALRYVGQVLGAPVPSHVLDALDAVPGAHPGGLRLRWMDAMFTRVLCPPHSLCTDRWTPVARGFLYLRGHWLRMPPHLLAMHLTRKLFVSSSKGE